MELWKITNIDFSKGMDASIAISPILDHTPRTFELPNASTSSICACRNGASVNCETITICAHSNGTHTESIGHIVNEYLSINTVKVPFLLPTRLVTVQPNANGEITLEEIRNQIGNNSNGIQALAVRAFGSYDSKARISVDYSNSNPPFFTSDAIMYVRDELQVHHLLVDLPSVDSEQCGLAMPVHSIFFGLSPGCKDLKLMDTKFANHTITELCNFHSEFKDGFYYVSLQISPIESDAVPSRPVFFPNPILNS